VFGNFAPLLLLPQFHEKPSALLALENMQIVESG
jgi:hypothetical protein